MAERENLFVINNKILNLTKQTKKHTYTVKTIKINKYINYLHYD